jgi:cytochrome c553
VRRAWLRLAAGWSIAGIGCAAAADPYAFFPADAERGRELAVVCLACHGTADVLAGAEPTFHVPMLAGQRGEAIFAALRDYQSGARDGAVMRPLVADLSIQDMRDVAAYLAAGGPYVPSTEDA